MDVLVFLINSYPGFACFMLAREYKNNHKYMLEENADSKQRKVYFINYYGRIVLGIITLVMANCFFPIIGPPLFYTK